MDDKGRYRELCKVIDMPIFNKDWFLDIVAGLAWGAVVAENGGKIVAAMPYFKLKKKQFTIITQPPLTQFLDLWYAPYNGKYAKMLSHQKNIIEYIFRKLPKFHSFTQCFSYRNTNVLPLQWLGFSTEVSYTYVIQDTGNLELIWQGFTDETKNAIKVAQTKYNLNVSTSDNIEQFLQFNENVFSQKELNLPYGKDLMRNLYKGCVINNAGCLLVATDNDGASVAYIFLVWDKESVYYLASGYNPDARNKKALDLLIWNGIRLASSQGKSFDFEGSVIKPIEKFVRGFGAKQHPYYVLKKTNSKLLGTYNFIRWLIK